MNRKLPIGPLLAGLILIVVGVVVLLQNVLAFELDWGIIWPWVLIVTGIVFLLENWRHNWWALIPLALGVVFLLENTGVVQGLEIGMLWPIAMILVGLSFIVNMFARGGAAARAEKRERRLEDQAYERGHRDGREAAAPAVSAPVASAPAEPIAAETGSAPVATTTRRGGLEDPNAPGFDPSARPADRPVSRLEDPSAPGFENGPSADASRR